MNKQFIMILLLILLIIVVVTKSNEFFDCNLFQKNLNNRINNIKNPYDRIIPLTPRGVSVNDCEICVFKTTCNNYDYGDYIPKPKKPYTGCNTCLNNSNCEENNNGCPCNTVYMNSCVYDPNNKYNLI